MAASGRFENDYDKEVYNGDLGVVSRASTSRQKPHAEFDGREAGASLCTNNPQEPGVGIPSCRDPAQHSALPDAEAETWSTPGVVKMSSIHLTRFGCTNLRANAV
jgi:hypothetical protein